MTIFNLRTARLRSGEQFRDVREVELDPLELGGQRYVPVPEQPDRSSSARLPSFRAASILTR